jgi:transcription initiation factor TFIIE subunit alpha
MKKRVLGILKMRLVYEENNDFYYCGTEECAKYTFEEAMECVFRCPTCGKPLKHYDNQEVIQSLKDRIAKIENIDST